jgi:aminoglycoside phosphotransferase (APT) family kinase protein
VLGLKVCRADTLAYRICFYRWTSALRTLSALHRINPSSIGLDGYGKPSDFYPRQLKALSTISTIQGKTKDKETGEQVGEIPGFADLVTWFRENLPKDENTICHGDYKIDNLVSGSRHW